jgi:hypothetical protein
MKISVQYIAIFLVIIFVACGSSDEEKARVKLDYAKDLLQKKDTTHALLQLDSIQKMYPEAIYSVNAAKNLGKELLFELMQKKENELDSLNLRIVELEKLFVKEKTEFDRYAQYTHKRQTFKRAWDRSYIQVHLNERGELYLSSNYHGANWLNHTGLRVYDSGDEAKTNTIAIGSVDNHHSDFMEAKWEKVTYRNGNDNGVIEFIASNVDRNLKAVFLGKEYFYIILETYDKEAVRDALKLSVALKRKKALEDDIKDTQKKLNIN